MRLLTIVIFLLSLIACANGTSSKNQRNSIEAWWLTVRFNANENKINNKDIQLIDKNWIGARLLDKKTLVDKVTQNELEEFSSSNLRFQLNVDMNKDGIKENIYVGVYRTREGEGRFLIVEQNNKVIKKFERGETAGFSALLTYDDEVRWYDCMQCGSYDQLSAIDGDYSLVFH